MTEIPAQNQVITLNQDNQKDGLRLIITSYNDYIVEGIITEYNEEYEDYEMKGEYRIAFSAKGDGCIHFYEAKDVPFSKEYGLHEENRKHPACDNYIHICSIERNIKILQLMQKGIKTILKEYEENF